MILSLRWRLTLWHLCLTAAGLLGFVLISYQVLAESLRAEIDRTLAERANHVTDALAVVPNRPVEGISQEATDEFRSPGVYVQLFNTEGILVAHSFNLGGQQLPVTPETVQQILAGQSFYLSAQIEGQPIRLFHQPVRRGGVIVGAAQVGQSLTGLESTLERLRVIYAIGTTLVLGFGLLGGWVLARLGLQPVARITQAAHTIALAEDLSRRVPNTGTRDEIGALAITFNEMLDRLQRLFESQQRFLAEAAHELRTPLSSMLGNVDLVARYSNDPTQRQETVMALQHTGRHVARLLDDLLLLAQAEAGWHLHDLRTLSLDDIFLEAYEAAKALPGGSGLRMQLCQPVQVHGDPDRLRQVFTNLIDNAIKYSASDSIVTLQLSRQANQALVQICNSNSIITAEALPRLFEPFFRDSSARQLPGAGLGLAIVQWIVREHGGEVAVTHQRDSGVKVTVTLPVLPS